MTTIDFEIYGRIIAHLLCRRRVQITEVLADLSVDRADLERDEPALRRELADAWPSRRGISAMKFATALAQELTRLQFVFSDSQPEQAPSVPALAKPAVAVPSFLQPAPLTAAPPLSVAPSFSPSPLAIPLDPVAPAAPKVNRLPDLAGTADTDMSVIIAGIRAGGLPFVEHPEAPPPAASDRAPAMQALPASITDFARHPVDPVAPAAPKLNRLPNLAGTADADMSVIIAGIRAGGLPFVEPPKVPPPPASAAPGSAATQALPAYSIDFARYPLELYARVTAALARGEPREEVLAAHQLNTDLFDSIARAWTTRFRDEPALLERFRCLVRGRGGQGQQGD